MNPRGVTAGILPWEISGLSVLLPCQRPDVTKSGKPHGVPQFSSEVFRHGMRSHDASQHLDRHRVRTADGPYPRQATVPPSRLPLRDNDRIVPVRCRDQIDNH